MAVVGIDSARILQQSVKGWIKRDTEQSLISAELVAGERDSFTQGRKYERPFWAELKCVPGKNNEVHLQKAKHFIGKDLGPTHGPWAESPLGWFGAGYGPFRRLYGASPEAQRIMSGPSRLARFATMFREDATLGECEQWLKELNYKALEGKEKEEGILKSVIELLNSDFLRNGLLIDRVDSEGLWLRDQSGVILPLADMSEGYRAALALLVDILRHMIHTYGTEGIVIHEKGEPIVPHSGIILIDEVDAHLHPEWQRQIGFWMKRHFPKCQFIVTSHSAIICQAADQNGIYHLPAASSAQPPFRLSPDDYTKIVRSTCDNILISPAFQMEYTRSPKAVSSRKRFSQLRAKAAAGRISANEKSEYQSLLKFLDDDEQEMVTHEETVEVTA